MSRPFRAEEVVSNFYLSDIQGSKLKLKPTTSSGMTKLSFWVFGKLSIEAKARIKGLRRPYIDLFPTKSISIQRTEDPFKRVTPVSQRRHGES